MEELWKDVIGHEGLYQVSNFGRVKSFHDRTRIGGKEGHFLKPTLIGTNGYLTVTLYKNKVRTKTTVHRLVATHFIPNPNDLPCVNHIDENKTNNRVDNLEWCTYLYNNNYGTAIQRKIDTVSEPVMQISPDGVVMAVYRSPRIAAKLLGFHHFNILNAAHNRTESAHGYVWIPASREIFHGAKNNSTACATNNTTKE